MDNSSLLRIQMNSAEQAAEQARAAYIASLPVAEQANFFMTAVEPQITVATHEARQLEAVDRFVLKMLERETGSADSLDTVRNMTDAEVTKKEAEIEELKRQIRMERRLFLDASPTTSPAVAGTYFMQVPDNKLLLALTVTGGAFLFFVSIGVFLGLFPIPRLEATSVSERIGLIVGMWVAAILMGYLGLYAFT